ncbi:MAG: response regulator [Rickettsiales bacterium]|nr:response regulator [Rickettsiales bacterium]
MAYGRILLVEDTPDYRETVAEYLTACGYEVMEVANGNEGLKCMDTYTPDAVLCDINMPELGGLEMLEKYRKEGHSPAQEVPFIFLTCNSNAEYRRKGFDLGCDAYIEKNTDLDVLQSVVESKIFKHRNQLAMQKKCENQVREQILTLLSEDLFSPLNTIQGYSDLIRAETYGPMPSEKYHDYLNMINHATNYEIQVITAIREMMYIALSKRKLDYSLISATKLMKEALENAKQSNAIPINAIDVVTDFPDTEAHFKGDMALLEKALALLIVEYLFVQEDTSDTLYLGITFMEEDIVLRVSSSKELQEKHIECCQVVKEEDMTHSSHFHGLLALRFAFYTAKLHRGELCMCEDGEHVGIALKLPR